MIDEEYEIKVVGEKSEYGDGAIRCIKNKGRFDLIQSNVLESIIWELNTLAALCCSNDNIDKDNDAVTNLFKSDNIYIDAFRADDNDDLYAEIIIRLAVREYYMNDTNRKKYFNSNTPDFGNYKYSKVHHIFKKCVLLMIQELAIHFQKGAEKYGERNCEHGLPLWTFRDSGLRHLTQYILETNDGENHFISSIWNFWMLNWTLVNNRKEIT